MPTLAETYDERYYAGHSTGSYESALVVLPIVFEQLGMPASILDVGCGVGTWLKAAQDLLGNVETLGVDHPQPNRSSSPPGSSKRGAKLGAPPLLIAEHEFLGADLSQPLDLGRKFDLVLSLEVAEHLEAKFAGQFVQNLVRHGDAVVFSAAIPGQGGRYHLNERFPAYWIEQFATAGFTCYDTLRPRLWLREDLEFWYQQNLLIFGRAPNERLAALPSYRGEPLVHPYLIKQRLNRGWAQLTKPLRRRLLKALGLPRYRKMHIEQW